VQYYDNIRFVYEIESKVRELRRAATPAEPSAEPKKENRGNDNTSGQPDQRQDRNYSQEDSQTVFAGLELPSDLVARSAKLEARSCLAVTTNRRFV
jgi:hypothetical protein